MDERGFMRVLYQFPLSHYCEKARWILDYKELDYVAHNLVPGLHRSFVNRKTKAQSHTLPLLNDQQHWVADSTKIALYLDEQYPEKKVIRSHYAMKSTIYEINQIASELGEYVRRWTLAHIILNHPESLDIIVGERGYLKKFERYSKPFIKSLLQKNYQLNEDSLKEAYEHIIRLTNQLNQYAERKVGTYLIGDRLSLADISVCSMLAPLLNIAGTPWEQDVKQRTEDTLYLEEKIKNLAIGHYILQIYATERDARTDWRGI